MIRRMVLLGPVLLALGLRLWALDEVPATVNADEISVTLLAAHLPWAALTGTCWGGAPALGLVPYKAALALGGPTLIAARLGSVAYGLVMVAALTAAAWLLFGDVWAAAAAGSLVATNHVLLHWSRVATGWIGAPAATAVVLWCFLRVHRDGWRWVGPLALALAWAPQTYRIAILAPALTGVTVLLWGPRLGRRTVAATTLAGVLAVGLLRMLPVWSEFRETRGNLLMWTHPNWEIFLRQQAARGCEGVGHALLCHAGDALGAVFHGPDRITGTAFPMVDPVVAACLLLGIPALLWHARRDLTAFVVVVWASAYFFCGMYLDVGQAPAYHRAATLLLFTNLGAVWVIRHLEPRWWRPIIALLVVASATLHLRAYFWVAPAGPPEATALVTVQCASRTLRPAIVNPAAGVQFFLDACPSARSLPR
jgi:hypothetical protein